MKKYYLKNGKEVKVGDKIVLKKTEKTEYGNSFIKQCILVTEASLPYLLEHNIIECKEDKKVEDKNIMTKIITKIGNSLGLDKEETLGFLYTVQKVNESALRNILYKKLAVEFDKVYPDYIADAEKIWVINSMYDTVDIVPKSKYMNFKNFAAFRTREDAEKAAKLVDDFIAN